VWTVPSGVKAYFAGVFVVGGLFASMLGVLMLPFSIAGLIFFGLGFLGLIPFVAAWVYFRNAIRAYRAAVSTFKGKMLVLTVMLIAAILVLGIPVLVQSRVNDAIEQATKQLVITSPALDVNRKAVSQLLTINQLCFSLCKTTIYAAFADVIAQNPSLDMELKSSFQGVVGEAYPLYQCSAE
jgi:hypothetical protein